MAANFLPGHDGLFKIFNDSGSEHKFEGYDPEDLEEDFDRCMKCVIFIKKDRSLDLQFCGAPRL